MSIVIQGKQKQHKTVNIKREILKYKNWYTRQIEILNVYAPNSKNLKYRK